MKENSIFILLLNQGLTYSKAFLTINQNPTYDTQTPDDPIGRGNPEPLLCHHLRQH